MIRRLIREFYFLARGEQRAMVLLSALLILGIVVRLCLQWIPGRDPPGWEQFLHESERIMTAIAAGEGRPDLPGTSMKARPDLPGTQAIDMNRADSADLLPLPGIGPVFAGRIIRYRELLGGYTGITQLHEEYGLPAETIERISSRLIFDPLHIRRIKVKEASFSDLLRHPYLDVGDVKALLRYREYRGAFSTLEEIRENGLLADSTLQKISPYLDLDR